MSRKPSCLSQLRRKICVVVKIKKTMSRACRGASGASVINDVLGRGLGRWKSPSHLSHRAFLLRQRNLKLAGRIPHGVNSNKCDQRLGAVQRGSSVPIGSIWTIVLLDHRGRRQAKHLEGSRYVALPIVTDEGKPSGEVWEKPRILYHPRQLH